MENLHTDLYHFQMDFDTSLELEMELECKRILRIDLVYPLSDALLDLEDPLEADLWSIVSP